MNRFRRWLFNGIVAVSLLLSLATVALWVRSNSHCDTLQVQRTAETLTTANTAPFELAFAKDWRARLGWSKIYRSNLMIAGAETRRFFWGWEVNFRQTNQL
jgi:hypothetical protein